ncbi:MAG: carboxypeptidase regulatory-like domain-containing protein [Bryobacteraceae bacterium]
MIRNLCNLALLVVTLFAQTERGNITGQVKDPSGAAIAGAEVTATYATTNVQARTVTTGAGEYNLPAAPGLYHVVISASGFKRYVRDNVTVPAATTVRLDSTLELGSVNESVEVTADVALLQSETAKVSTSVQNRLVDELPLVVGGALRSPFDLVSIVPEARIASGTSLALGGGQASAWDATIDGLSVTTNRSANQTEIAYNTPSVEAITEFTVDTNGFKAEYGQAGGGVMTFSSKSGTNQLHGVAYDFLRNDDLDARGFFAKTRSVYKQNDFGATLGGPVYIPKLYHGKDRTFFFLSYEGFRNRVGSNGQIFSVPTPEMYRGDFSKWVDSKGNVIPIYDPATTRQNPSGAGTIRDAFPNNQIPVSRFSSLASQILPYGAVVKPNRGGTPGTLAYVQNNYISTTGSLLSPTDKGSAKVDHIIGNNHRLGFLFNITRFRQEPGAEGPPGLPAPLWNGQELLFNTEIYRLTYDWTLSPTLLNHLSAGGNHFIKNSFTPNVGQNWKSKLCMKNVIDCGVNFPEVTFSEFMQWGGDAYNGTEQPSWSVKDDLNYTRGKHNFKFGYAFESQRANGFGQQLISGVSGYSFLGTSVPGATSFSSGSSFASFLLGWADSGGTQTNLYQPQRFGYNGFYAQDDWHINQKLTLNLGLRYEYTDPPISLNNQYSDFTPNLPNPAANNYPGALRFAGFGPGTQNSRSLVPGWYGAIGPRIGLAYSPDGKTTVRSGFGRSFSKVTVVSGSGHQAGFIGSYSFKSPDQDVTPAFLLDNGLPGYQLPPQLNPSFSNNQNVDFWQGQNATRAPENLYWTLSVQRQVTANTLIEVEYNANIGTHLQAGLVNLNQAPTAYLNRFVQQYGAAGALNLLRSNINSPLARAAGIPIPYANFTDPSVQLVETVAQALRPYPQYQTINTGGAGGDKSGHSSYHALVIKAQRRFSAGLTFQWSYAFSKLLTDADSYTTGGFAEDQYNRRLEKSIGAYDQTHSLKLNTLYELPFGTGKAFLSNSKFASRLMGGWRLGAIQAYNSGFPLALTRNNPLPIFNGPTRPLISSYTNWRAKTAGGGFDPNVDKYLDKAAFPAQPVAGFGNATRYNPKLRPFPLFNENVSLAKSFYITESKRIDFRWEAFNIFNRTQFGQPNVNLDSSTFGVVSTQANMPRQMQAALKFYW